MLGFQVQHTLMQPSGPYHSGRSLCQLQHKSMLAKPFAAYLITRASLHTTLGLSRKGLFPTASWWGPWFMATTTCRKNKCQRACTRHRKMVCKAFALPEYVDITIRNVISISAVVGISYAVLLAAVSEPAPPRPPAPTHVLPPGPTPGSINNPHAAGGRRHEEDNFVWGLMGFISILPLFDWLAWVLAAISDDDRAALYGIYAALYGSPLLLRGLDWQDPWVLFMLALCVVHVQAERISQTEPEALRSIRPLGAVGALLRGVLGGTGSLLRGLSGVLTEDARRAVRRPGGLNSSSGTEGSRSFPPRVELGAGEDRMQLGQDAELRESGYAPETVSTERLIDPRRDPTRDPELEDFAKKELVMFDEQLKEAEQRRLGLDSRRGGSGDSSSSSSSGGGGVGDL